MALEIITSPVRGALRWPLSGTSKLLEIAGLRQPNTTESITIPDEMLGRIVVVGDTSRTRQIAKSTGAALVRRNVVASGDSVAMSPVINSRFEAAHTSEGRFQERQQRTAIGKLEDQLHDAIDDVTVVVPDQRLVVPDSDAEELVDTKSQYDAQVFVMPPFAATQLGISSYQAMSSGGIAVLMEQHKWVTYGATWTAPIFSDGPKE